MIISIRYYGLPVKVAQMRVPVLYYKQKILLYPQLASAPHTVVDILMNVAAGESGKLAGQRR